MDQRDETTWVTIELSTQGEQKVEEGIIDQLLRQDLEVDAEFPIFIPAVTYTKGRRSVTLHLLEGYAFVASGLPEVQYYALEQKPYVERVITIQSHQKIRTLSVIPDQHIRKLRKQLQEMIAADIRVGETVRVTDGQYKGLDGIVTGLDGPYAYVFIRLRSLQVVATVLRVFLDSLDSESLDKKDAESLITR